MRAAARQVAEAAVAAGHTVAGVNVAAMVPSLCPVDRDGVPIGPGLLYGDERAKGGVRGLDPSQDGELVRMLTWMAAAHPEAAGYWPAQAVGNAALCGAGVIDSVTAMTTLPLFDFTGWDPAVCAGAGVRADQLPGIRSGAAPAGTIGPDLGPALAGAVVGGGTIDAFGEQLVAGADEVGDVLLIMGATLIVWACVADWVEAPGLWTVPHTAPGKVLVGGPSNAGGILKDWAATVLVRPGEGGDAGDPMAGVTAGEWSTRPTCRWCCPTCGASGPPCTTGTGGGRSTGCPSPTDRRPCGAASTRPRATRSATTWTWPGCWARSRWPAASWPPGVACATPPGCRPWRT